MYFRDVIGQEKIKEQLIRSVAENRVSHAQLFLGPEGCGNLAMALAFAQYINCEQRKPGDPDSCGTCPSCLKASKYIHPDIHFTFPFIFVDKKKEICSDWIQEWRTFLTETPYGNYNDWIASIEVDNKQGNINARECLEIIHKLSLKTFESPYKILILWLPEFLEKEGNRLLKIIEEPPDNTVFLMVAHNAEVIINTILSRLQLLRFPRLPEDIVAEALASQGVPSELAMQYAALGDGDYRESLQLAHAEENGNTQMLGEWLDCCARQNVKELFAWNDRFVKLSRESHKNFFAYCLHFFREVLLMHHHTASLCRLNTEETAMARGLGDTPGSERSMDCIALLDKAIYFIERNVNAKILVTHISITLMKQFGDKAETHKNAFFYNW